jgi:hypothetical protein
MSRRTLVILAALFAACRNDRPGEPTPIRATSPASDQSHPPSVAYEVAGVVVDTAGAPVAGAVVTFSGSARETRETVTDPTGAFKQIVEARQSGIVATVGKAGYEVTRQWISLNVDRVTSQTLRLHEIQRIDSGQSLRLALAPDDPGCAFELYLCRTVRVGSTLTGTLVLEVIPDDPAAQLGLILAGNDPNLTTTTRLTVPVLARSEVRVEIVAFRFDWLSPGLTLTTTFSPG